jgi:hypothetical protein
MVKVAREYLSEDLFEDALPVEGIEMIAYIGPSFSIPLKTLSEPSYLDATGLESYRFIYSRSFNAPIVVRVEHAEEGKYRVISKVGEADGTGDPEREQKGIKYQRERFLSEYEVSQFYALLNLVNFWKMKFEDYEEDPGLDGATWAFEGTKKGDHQLFHRWSPKTCDVYYLGVYFLYLGGIEGELIY